MDLNFGSVVVELKILILVLLFWIKHQTLNPTLNQASNVCASYIIVDNRLISTIWDISSSFAMHEFEMLFKMAVNLMFVLYLFHLSLQLPLAVFDIIIDKSMII